MFYWIRSCGILLWFALSVNMYSAELIMPPTTEWIYKWINLIKSVSCDAECQYVLKYSNWFCIFFLPVNGNPVIKRQATNKQTPTLTHCVCPGLKLNLRSSLEVSLIWVTMPHVILYGQVSNSRLIFLSTQALEIGRQRLILRLLYSGLCCSF